MQKLCNVRHRDYGQNNKPLNLCVHIISIHKLTSTATINWLTVS